MHIIGDTGHFELTRISEGVYEIFQMKEGASGNGWYPSAKWADVKELPTGGPYPYESATPTGNEYFPDLYCAVEWAIDQCPSN